MILSSSVKFLRFLGGWGEEKRCSFFFFFFFFEESWKEGVLVF